MQDLWQLLGIGVVAATLAVLLRNWRPEMAIMVSLAAAVVLFLLMQPRFQEIVTAFNQLTERSGLADGYMPVLLKMLGITIMTELGVQWCKDAGEGAIASKLELGGKLLVLSLVLPLTGNILNIVLGMLP